MAPLQVERPAPKKLVVEAVVAKKFVVVAPVPVAFVKRRFGKVVTPVALTLPSLLTVRKAVPVEEDTWKILLDCPGVAVTLRVAVGLVVPIPTLTAYAPVPPKTSEFDADTLAIAPIAVMFVSPAERVSAWAPINTLSEAVLE